MLSDTPRQKLAAIIALDGVRLAFDAKLCEALLRDYCGEYRLEIAALSAAVRWGIPKSLQEPSGVPPATLRAQLARRLQENHGLAEEAAFWAVDAWSSVLTQLASGTLGTEQNLAAPATQSMPTISPAPPPGPPVAPQSPTLTPLVPSPSIVRSAPPPRPSPLPQSPVLPPLPKPPSVAPAPPPVRPTWQAQSPPLPAPPVNLSQPPPRPAPPVYQPPLPPQPTAFPPPVGQAVSPAQFPVPVPPQLLPSQPLQPAELLAAAHAFESGQISPHLLRLKSYLQSEIKNKKRQPAGLVGELQNAGIQPHTAQRLVKQAQKGQAVKHFWIAVVCLLFTTPLLRESIGYLLFIIALVYLIYRGIRLIESF